EKLILIQCKNVETPVNVHIVRVFESALSRFSSDSLGLIVYNSKKLDENFATPKAKNWATTTSKKNIKICNEKEFVEIIKNFFENDNDNNIELINYTTDSFDLINLVGKNVSIGTIGVGKTTCAELLETFLIRKGFTVKRYKELSLQVTEEFHIFNKDKQKNLLFFQYSLLNNFNYIILDRTQKDMKIFNKFLQDPVEKEYIDRKIDSIELLDFYKVVYVTAPIEMSIERQQTRARFGELVDREYLETINNYYLEDIDLVYPENLKFENT
ncbi:31521_t:CDS:2, partial [Racocetra persica]